MCGGIFILTKEQMFVKMNLERTFAKNIVIVNGRKGERVMSGETDKTKEESIRKMILQMLETVSNVKQLETIYTYIKYYLKK